MDNNLKITDFGNNILYIENAFPKHKEFLEAISDDNLSGDIVSIIPKWSIWLDGKPEYQEDDWEHVFPDKDNEIYDAMQRGIVKTFDWDRSINNDNNHWPRIQVNPDYSNAHKKAHEIIKMIDEPYKDMLEIWRKKFNEYDLQYISKNYCIRQYKVGGDMGVHVDRHVDNPRNNMDWTALIYLTDTYEGGELVFDDYKITLRPSAGKIGRAHV